MKRIHTVRSMVFGCLPQAAWCQQATSWAQFHRYNVRQFGLACISMLISMSIVPVALAQDSAVTHNTWSSGAPMPHSAASGAAVVLGKGIVLLGGIVDLNGTAVADTLVYNPASNTWSKGRPLPMPIIAPAGAAVNNVLYVFGGLVNKESTFSNAVWAYDLRSKTWSSKSPMPTARSDAAAVVAGKNNIIYVVGGRNPTRLDTVESYDPATDTWTEEAPLLAGKSNLTVGVAGTWIVAADGYTGVGDTGDNEVYNTLTNTWTRVAYDPTQRDAACGGAIGSIMYVAGGYQGNGGPAMTLTESFRFDNTWETLADMPQATIVSASAVYNGQLYCFGGQTGWRGTLLDNVQIYQP